MNSFKVVKALVVALVAFSFLATAGVAVATSIPSTQDPSAGPAFIGEAATANPLPHQPMLRPVTTGMHANGGNTKVYETPGPLGVNPEVSSVMGTGSNFMFDDFGRMNGGLAVFYDANNPAAYYTTIAAYDPETLNILATWDTPEGQTINSPYMIQTAGGQLLVPSKQGHIYVIDRYDDLDTPEFLATRDIDLVELGVLDGTSPLLAVAFDVKGNIWFTTGGILGVGEQPGPDAVVGYVDRKGTAHWITLENQVVENGIAVNQKGVFVLTGPAGDADVEGATGHVYAFRAEEGIETIWSEEYDAGSSIKPGGFARGTGSTPTLLGHRYLAMTNNADGQISVNFYHQSSDTCGSQLAGSIPVFEEGASANDIGMIGVMYNDIASVVVLNDYNAPPVFTTLANGPLQSMNDMAPGVQRIDIDDEGNCTTAWSLPIRIKSVPVVSAETGLMYGYTQDEELAAEGIYVWYVVAIDYETGDVVWKIRTGAGYSYNDSYRAACLSPDGTFYQGTLLGNVILRDGE